MLSWLPDILIIILIINGIVILWMILVFFIGKFMSLWLKDK